jgi:hypothetical protein
MVSGQSAFPSSFTVSKNTLVIWLERCNAWAFWKARTQHRLGSRQLPLTQIASGDAGTISDFSRSRRSQGAFIENPLRRRWTSIFVYLPKPPPPKVEKPHQQGTGGLLRASPSVFRSRPGRRRHRRSARNALKGNPGGLGTLKKCHVSHFSMRAALALHSSSAQFV